MTEFHFAIIEQPAAYPPEQRVWMQTEFPSLPLMQQENLQHLSHAGPWLVALDEAAFSRMNTSESAFERGQGQLERKKLVATTATRLG